MNKWSFFKIINHFQVYFMFVLSLYKNVRWPCMYPFRKQHKGKQPTAALLSVKRRNMFANICSKWHTAKKTQLTSFLVLCSTTFLKIPFLHCNFITDKVINIVYYNVLRHIFCNLILTLERNWVFATNINFLTPISLQPDSVNLWYFKFRLFDLPELIVWNIKCLGKRVAKL